MTEWDETSLESRMVEPSVRAGRRVVRRRRADFGSIKATERDFELLGFVGEQYAVTLPQLAKLIGRRVETARSRGTAGRAPGGFTPRSSSRRRRLLSG